MKKYFSPLLLLATILLFSFHLPDRANFSGTWALNEGKSDLGQFARFATRKIVVDQQNDSISIDRTAPGFTGDDFTSNEVLKFDGTQGTTNLYGTSKKYGSAKWSDDGQTFMISYKLLMDFNGQTTEINGTETWTLADGGNTLNIQNSSSSSFGDRKTTSVFDKQ
jgi:hypothetical protein